MAMKKVEEKNKKEVSIKNKNNDKVVEAVVEEEKVVCEECGKKYLSSLNECPKCGYSTLTNNKKKTFYDDEEEFEDYDDEDEEVHVSHKEEKEVKEEIKKEEVKKVEKKETKKEEKNNKMNKESKKEEKAVNKKVSVENKKSMLADDDNDIVSFIKIVVVIVLLVAVVWLVASFLNKNKDDNNKKEESETVATIQNDKILGSSIFDKDDKTYYVFVYNASKDNKHADYYSVLFSEYDMVEDKDKLPMFWVDLNDPFNKDIIALKVEDVNTKPKKYEDLSIYNLALIRIKNGKLDKYYDGEYAIDKLTRLISSFKEKEEK